MFRLSLRSLLIGLFALLALIVGGEGILAINKIAAVNANLIDISTNWMPSMDVVRRMNATAEQYRVYQARHVMATTEDELARQEAAVAKTGEALAAAHKQYAGMIVTADERTIYQSLNDSLGIYTQLVPQLIKLSRANQKVEATRMYVGEMSTRFTAVRNDLTKLAELNDRGAKEATEAAAANYSAARLITSVTLTVGLLIALGAMAFSFFGIARPIGRITDAMGVLAGGDTKAEIPFAARKDEIGQMAAAVQVFRDNMIRARALEAEQAETEQRTAVQRKADMHKLADEFQAAVGAIVNTVSANSTQLEAAAGTLTRTAAVTQ